jgi:hypothetical protein
MEYMSCQSHPADREQAIQYNGPALLKRARSSIDPLAVMFGVTLNLSNAPVVFAVVDADLDRSMDLYVFWNYACLPKMLPRCNTKILVRSSKMNGDDGEMKYVVLELNDRSAVFHFDALSSRENFEDPPT